MSKKSGAGKFVPLSQADIQKEKILLSGRRECTCEASKHALINNCLDCGRIVCEQEGSGPCFTCNNLVCTPKEREIIMRQSKQSVKLYNKLMNLEATDVRNLPTEDKNLKSAIDHRNRLLEYDRSDERRTRVIDDENDFFQTDSRWLSEKERSILTAKQQEIYDLMHSRRKQKITLDFAGREIREETEDFSVDVDELLRSELLKEDQSIFEADSFLTGDIPEDFRNPVYQEGKRKGYQEPVEKPSSKLGLRIQDKGLQEMSDEAYCLSMHQPYASLLVAGVKKHEGRVWYTSYRGRLWIHAAGRVPAKPEIEEVETFYRNTLVGCVFPKVYPTSCLVGCVDMTDCLPQEEYSQLHPKGESASPYVFICENPQELKIKFPMKGKHKLFKLESNIHLAAKKTLSTKIVK